MRQFATSVLERRWAVDGQLLTEPYETAWASEATFYVRLHSESADIPTLSCWAQTSLDGIAWVDLPNAVLPVGGAGDHRMPLTHFDGWLRLVVEPTQGEDYTGVGVTVALVLKE
jgi:hypothetical protein